MVPRILCRLSISEDHLMELTNIFSAKNVEQIRQKLFRQDSRIPTEKRKLVREIGGQIAVFD